MDGTRCYRCPPAICHRDINRSWFTDFDLHHSRPDHRLIAKLTNLKNNLRYTGTSNFEFVLSAWLVLDCADTGELLDGSQYWP
jgi:hypothetical protein